jgi:hypothetical protein
MKTRDAFALGDIDPRTLAATPREAMNILGDTHDERARRVIGAKTIELLMQRPTTGLDDVPRLVYEVWEGVRYLKYDGIHPVEAAMGAGPLQQISQLLHTMINAGDLRDTLLRRRAEIDQALGRLDPLKEIRR